LYDVKIHFYCFNKKLEKKPEFERYHGFFAVLGLLDGTAEQSKGKEEEFTR
jgi:hypothetical protein